MLQKTWDRSLLDVLGWCRPYALATIWRMPPARCCHCLSTGCSSSRILSPLPGKGVSKRQAGRGLAATLPLWVPRRPLAAICCKMIPEAELRKAMVRVGLQTGPRLQSLTRSTLRWQMGRRHSAPVTRLSSWLAPSKTCPGLESEIPVLDRSSNSRIHEGVTKGDRSR